MATQLKDEVSIEQILNEMSVEEKARMITVSFRKDGEIRDSSHVYAG